MPQFDDIIAHALPTMRLIVYFNQAIDGKRWLEAIVLAHMYIETQLRTIAGKPIRKERWGKKVIRLAKSARDKDRIGEDLFHKIEEFNEARNDAVHNLASENITYDQLEPTARQGGKLINELLAIYNNNSFSPEQKADH
jgi:hypothetical protein